MVVKVGISYIVTPLREICLRYQTMAEDFTLHVTFDLRSSEIGTKSWHQFHCDAITGNLPEISHGGKDFTLHVTSDLRSPEISAKSWHQFHCDAITGNLPEISHGGRELHFACDIGFEVTRN